MTVPDSKVTSLIWGTLDHTIITGHENGSITQWDLRVCIVDRKLNLLYIILYSYVLVTRISKEYQYI